MDLDLYNSIYDIKIGKCLLVGNDSEMQRSVKTSIIACQYELIIIRDLSLAIAKMKEICPDLMFISIQEFNIPAENLYKTLKSEGCNISRIILLISPGIPDDIIQLYISQGIHHLVAFPAHSLDLQLRIKNWVTSHKYEQLVEERFQDLRIIKEKIEKEKSLLSRYFSKDLVTALFDGDISTDPGGTTTTASVLFCDLRHSTNIAESIEPSQFWDFLNNLFTDITDIIFGEGGAVNKFLGDGILATFGCPRPLEDDAWHCVQVAVKIRKYLNTFNQFKPSFLKLPIQLGIGITRGKLFAGNIGSVNRMEFTVLGDPVNLASRLESLTKKGNMDILMDGNLYDRVNELVKVKKVNIQNIRGKIIETQVYFLEKTLIRESSRKL